MVHKWRVVVHATLRAVLVSPTVATKPAPLRETEFTRNAWEQY